MLGVALGVAPPHDALLFPGVEPVLFPGVYAGCDLPTESGSGSH